MRDRLIRLLQKRSCYYNKCNGPCSNCDYITIDDDDISNLADYLLANGALVAPMPMADWLRDELSEYIDKRCFEEL